ncbi:aldehyde dehydrogenase family protein [Pseudodonghicola sp.]|uniref:aldehyde dehydrogenase family protein n=1 Tax=Pseudodonghicola sp. TaxID=1969463 RepID=UPI003A96EDEE
MSYPQQALLDAANAWLEKVQEKNLIDGEFRPAAQMLDVLEPATGKVLAKAPASGPAEVEEAMAAALRARETWAETPARQRGRLVAEAARKLKEEIPALAVLLTRETGKAIRTECRGELTVTADIMEMFGGLGSELKGETLPFAPDVFAVTTREPLGVVVAIVPWNVPVLLTMLKIAPALVAGNTVVVKASELAPFATIAAVSILAEMLPPGVVNVICGTGLDCGVPLTSHPGVAKITFTGSEAVGVSIYGVASERIIPVTLELGGKSPMIICADTDFDKAVEGVMQGMRFTRQGQSCTASSRVFIHADIFDSFVEALRARLDQLVIGDPLDEATDVGTIISPKQHAQICKYVDIAEAAPEATVIRCSALPTEGVDPTLFMQPTLVLGIDPDSPVAREEIFGPVVVMQSWTSLDDVIAEANDTDFGLGASIWTKDLATALQTTKKLDAGFVQVNAGYTIQPNLSYGGFGRSGLGKEASLESMLEHFTRKKTIIMSMA